MTELAALGLRDLAIADRRLQTQKGIAVRSGVSSVEFLCYHVCFLTSTLSLPLE